VEHGVAIVHRQELTVAPVALTTAVQSLESLVLKLISQRGRVNVAALYRPPSSSPYGVTASQFCGGFADYVDELLALCGD